MGEVATKLFSGIYFCERRIYTLLCHLLSIFSLVHFYTRMAAHNNAPKFLSSRPLMRENGSPPICYSLKQMTNTSDREKCHLYSFSSYLLVSGKYLCDDVRGKDRLLYL